MNCHLHFDHCGGNPLLAGAPILVQDVELATAHGGDYTFDELLDFPGAGYEELTGETEIWPGVPGHPMVLAPSRDSRMMSACPACCAVSAMMCSST